MTLRLAELVPADQYFLDCAHESDELDRTSYLALRLHGDRDEIHEIVDARPIPETPELVRSWFSGRPCHNGWRDRQARCARLAQAADRVLSRLDPTEAGGLIWASWSRAPRLLLMCAETCANFAYEDATTGGAMLDYHYRGVGRDGEPTRRVARRLRAPRFVRKYVRDQRETRENRERMSRLLARTALVPPECVRDTTSEMEAQLGAQHAAEQQRRWASLIERDRETSPHGEPLARLKKGVLRQRREQRREHRKVLRRAASTAVAVMGRERVSALARGREVEIVGSEMRLLVQLRRSLAARGQGALAVAVADVAGARLGELCVYFEETPALDQATALTLHVEGGDEREVLETANLTFVTQAGRDHPLLRDRAAALRVPHDAPRSRIVDAAGRRVLDRDRQENLQRLYRQSTRALWVDAVCSRVLPGRALARRMAETISTLA